MKWQDDYGYKPAFKIPPCIESGENKNCSKEDFLKWADSQYFYRFALILREGTTEWNARFCLNDKLLRTLEHGKIYAWADLGKDKKGKVQFVVESLLNEPEASISGKEEE